MTRTSEAKSKAQRMQNKLKWWGRKAMRNRYLWRKWIPSVASPRPTPIASRRRPLWSWTPTSSTSPQSCNPKPPRTLTAAECRTTKALKAHAMQVFTSNSNYQQSLIPSKLEIRFIPKPLKTPIPKFPLLQSWTTLGKWTPQEWATHHFFLLLVTLLHY